MKPETHDRLADLRARMAENGADLVALGPGAHMQWLLGFHPHADERPCLLLVGKESEVLLMPELNATGSRAHTDIPFQQWSDAEGPRNALTAALSAVDGKRAAQVVLDETMRADFALLLLDALPGAKPSFGERTVGALRMVKDAGEVAELKMNAGIADRAMEKAFAALRPGVREIDIAAVVREHFVSEGAEPMFTIIGTGPNGAFPHHQTGERVVVAGDAVVIDIGGRKGAYSSDITRMAAVGTAPEGYADIHAIVESAVQAATTAARPGVPAKTVDAAARGVIEAAGYGDYFLHRTGHGLGVEIHEPPYITATSETVLESGMVFSIEPGIYLPDRFGLRLEEIVVLRDDGPEVLSSLPRTLRVVGG